MIIAFLAGACAQPVKVRLPEPLDPVYPKVSATAQALATGTPPSEALRRSPTPTPPGVGSAASGLGVYEGMPPVKGGPVNANIEGVPVPAFINEFFGNILAVTFQMDPAVAKLNDLVTLRTSGPQSPANFYRLAVQVLKAYGVSTSYEDGRVLFRLKSQGGDFEPPLVLSGRTLPQVPVTHRPIFQLVELQSVRTSDVNQWLRTAFKTDGLEIQDDLNRNAVVLYGKPDIVRQAVAAIQVLDRPYMRGRVSTRLEPAFVTADELAKRLVDVLVAEGYGASIHTGQGVIQSTAVVVLPLSSANTVLIFAADAGVLEHAVEWARTIDHPNPTAGADSLFYYLAQNTRAEDIAKTLNGVRAAAAQPVAAAVPALAGPAAVAVTPAAAGGLSGGRLVVDEPRNALIFQGPASDWGRILPLVKQMDKAARQVMIEVTIAEVSLDDNEEFGISWLAKNDVGRFNGTLSQGVLAGATSGSSGLTYLLDVAGQTRAQLRAFAEDNRVTVLSTPRLMVKSGAEASIDVGTEVPTVSSQSTSPQQTQGTSNLLQTIQYRKTGIILNIKPIIYSDNRVDLEIRQEVSEALPLGTNSAVQSPSIFNRAVSTSLSLRDGSSILIGGLMSSRMTNADSGVPYLKDIPILGNVFKSQTKRKNRTELILMIVPYIVESDDQATALTRSLGERYELLELPNSTVPINIKVVPSTPSPP
ncbi:type II secretion system protein GspD [Thermomonas sp.]|uniref:type II secretion system protein GspD n=1 Tax=Thermomonas sp. TaxID=1971895 RepID=UPI0024884A29|nr:type II secretion system protein GspD [Thermomonas sp.]MDI1254202.1 type II secretion system protein GspD [Thermomonas sp.]